MDTRWYSVDVSVDIALGRSTVSGTGDAEHLLFGSVEGEVIGPAIAGVTIDTKC